MKYRVKVKVCDPQFKPREIKKISGAESFTFPDELNKFDCLVIAVDHKQFKIKREKLIKLTKKNKYILDNYGIWENLNLNSEKMRYIVSGNKGWLN